MLFKLKTTDKNKSREGDSLHCGLYREASTGFTREKEKKVLSKVFFRYTEQTRLVIFKELLQLNVYKRCDISTVGM